MNALFWSDLLQKVLIVAVPILALSGASWVAAWINKAAKGLSADQMTAIHEAVSVGVNAAEQLGINKMIANKKAYAINLAQQYLAKQGVTVDLGLLDGMVESAVKTELNWHVPDPVPASVPDTLPTSHPAPDPKDQAGDPTGTIDPTLPRGEDQEAAQK